MATELIGHSQGTLLLTNALFGLSSADHNINNWTNLDVYFVGSAANYISGWRATRGVTGGKGSFDIQNAYGDFVGNIIGMNTVNPLRIAASLLNAPALYRSPNDPEYANANYTSPHSIYYWLPQWDND